MIIAIHNGTSYGYGSKPHAVTSFSGTSYTYDANGNMLIRGSQTLAWDAENRPITITTTNGTTTLVYDGDGNRVKKTENGQTILYVNKYYEKNLTTGNATSYYYLGGRLVAMKQGIANVSYIHQDHLTGTSVVSDSSGTLVCSIAYAPYGDCLKSQGNIGTDRLFTGQRLDNTGLYYYGARYYDPAIGRFISADTVGQHLSNPQTLNRYSYVGNNPLRYTDPTGHEYLLDGNGDFYWSDEPMGPQGDINAYWAAQGPALPLDHLVEFELEVLFDAFGQVWTFPNTDLGLIAMALSGGSSRPGPRSTTIVEGIDPDSVTGNLMEGVLHTRTFTLGYVILTLDSTLQPDTEEHELGHVTQYAILGAETLLDYGLDWLAAGGWWENPRDVHRRNVMETPPLLPNWPWLRSSR